MEVRVGHPRSDRVAFGKPLAEQGAVREAMTESRIALDQARALCHNAAHIIGSEGNKAARHVIAETKVSVPRTAANHRPSHPGAWGSRRADDTPLARMWGWHRACHGSRT
ncbi:MAG: acyl-CoA dehydrogenase [Marmoricola sp.]|nr:acyl-CoA dehydrogenase [Marmoricola sp.]